MLEHDGEIECPFSETFQWHTECCCCSNQLVGLSAWCLMLVYTVFGKKHPLSVSSVFPWKMFGLIENLQRKLEVDSVDVKVLFLNAVCVATFWVTQHLGIFFGIGLKGLRKLRKNL